MVPDSIKNQIFLPRIIEIQLITGYCQNLNGFTRYGWPVFEFK